MENLSKLLHRLELLYDGELLVTSKSGQWRFYLLDGQLLYVSHKSFAVRRFSRAARCHRPRWQWSVASDWPSFKQSWEIPLLERAIAHNKLSPIQAKLIIRMVLEECLFELIYDSTVSSEWSPYHLEASSVYRSAALSAAEVQRIVKKATRLAETWKRSRLGYLRLSDSPIVAPGIAEKSLSLPSQYLKGDTDLWDILLTQAPSLDDLTGLLLPMVKAQMITFKALPDLPLPTIEQASSRYPSTQPHASVRQPLPQPSSVAEQSSALPTKGTAQPGQSPLIACIDDSPVLTLSLKKILTSAGYRTLSIPEPMRGFSKLIEHQPDLILLDLILPNADGYSICKFLRETSTFAKIPIIILTGQASNIDRMRARLVGATDFLPKPPKPHDLTEMIHHYLFESHGV